MTCAWFMPLTAIAVAAAACGGDAPSGPDASGDLAPDARTDGGADATPDPPVASCDGDYAPPSPVDVAVNALVEASGIAPSRRNPGVLWLHNDSGDQGRLFAVGTDGAALGQLWLPQLAEPDLEDVATARCPDGVEQCVWIADTGNNDLDRDDLAVYAVPEPVVSAAAPLGITTATHAWRIPIRYDGATLDSEALAVAADGQTFYLLEKINEDRARIFVATGPFVDGVPVTMPVAGYLTSPAAGVDDGRKITGAALHPDGTRLLVRVYAGAVEYRGLTPGSLAGLDAAERVTVPVGGVPEWQGEAISYDETGRNVWTISEDPESEEPQPLHRYPCH